MGLKKLTGRPRRRIRIRKKVQGTTERPRLTVFRSHKYIYAQVIDDTSGKTLAASSSALKSLSSDGSKVEAAKVVGQSVAKACLDKGIDKVVFDRGGYRYHGRVRALADAAREAGLNF